jgi:hypothetical protein
MSRDWLPREEIITGERLQGLADLTLLPAHVERFHRHVERHAPQRVTFANHADITDAQVAQLSAARALFVYTHELAPFIEHIWPRLTGDGHVLITHNSDFEADDRHLEWLDATGPRLDRWFAQNVRVRHPKLEPLPIGIANAMWKHGNLRALEKAITRADGAPRPRLVHARFNPATNPRRAEIWRAVHAAFPELPADPPKPIRHRAYLRDLAEHRFCVCAPGNGIDSHRVWECLYLGVVPIVERSTHTELWVERGLPMILVEDWATITPGRLDAEHDLSTRASSPAVRDLLRLSHYARLVGSGTA